MYNCTADRGSGDGNSVSPPTQTHTMKNTVKKEGWLNFSFFWAFFGGPFLPHLATALHFWDAHLGHEGTGIYLLHLTRHRCEMQQEFRVGDALVRLGAPRKGISVVTHSVFSEIERIQCQSHETTENNAYSTVTCCCSGNANDRQTRIDHLLILPQEW